jgi:hypothetical protein
MCSSKKISVGKNLEETAPDLTHPIAEGRCVFDQQSRKEGQSGAGPRSIRLAGSMLGHRAHICAFFNSPEEAYRMLLPFIQEGLECGQKAVHTVDPRRREEHIQWLASAVINVDAVQRNAQFELRDWRGPDLEEVKMSFASAVS